MPAAADPVRRRTRRYDWDSGWDGLLRTSVALLRRLDPQIANRKQRPKIVFRQSLAGPLQPIHDAHDRATDRPAGLDGLDRLHDRFAGRQHVVDDGHPVAGVDPTLEPLL